MSVDDILLLNTTLLIERLLCLKDTESLVELRSLVADILENLDSMECVPPHSEQENSENVLLLRGSFLTDALNQIAESRTLDRARYYIERLIRGLTSERTSPINDINLNRWKEYDTILTDSLWHIDHRANSGVHTANYWGNFIPQIPHQMMLRYTKQGDWVLDTFAGAGTTLIEGQRLGRNTIGIELQADVVRQARRRLQKEPDTYGVTCKMITHDSLSVNYPKLLQEHGQERVHLVMMHPPYYDIIKFSDNPRDLSNAASLDTFLAKMGKLVERAVIDLAGIGDEAQRFNRILGQSCRGNAGKQGQQDARRHHHLESLHGVS